MRPKKTQHSGSGDLFRARLDQIINMDHELVRLARDRLGIAGRGRARKAPTHCAGRCVAGRTFE